MLVWQCGTLGNNLSELRHDVGPIPRHWVHIFVLNSIVSKFSTHLPMSSNIHSPGYDGTRGGSCLYTVFAIQVSGFVAITQTRDEVAKARQQRRVLNTQIPPKPQFSLCCMSDESQCRECLTI